MVTILVFDGMAHLDHPDEDERVSFCGESADSYDRIASGARYADDFLAEVATKEDVEICDECRALSEEWAAP